MTSTTRRGHIARRCTLALIVVAVSCSGTQPAAARDTRHLLSIKESLDGPAAKERLDARIRFYFGNQAHPAVERRLGEHVANRKTNSANKSDQVACTWVFLSALRALRDRAVKEGGNAVIDITSYYKKNEFVSDTEYECHAGAFIAGVALKGTVVKLAE